MVAGGLSNRQIAQEPAAIDVDVSGVSRDEPQRWLSIVKGYGDLRLSGDRF
jgi:hypothetical protein